MHRRPYRRTPLTAEQRAQLQAALGADLEIRWFERWNDRWRVARLNGLATDIRLRIPEAYRVHQRIIDWDRDFSPTGVAASSIGLDALTLKTMRWALKDWSRMERLNRLPAATLAARLQMDYLPGLGCAAHFLVAARALDLDAVRDPATLLRFGQPLQRFWLCAERLGLVLQPSLAPLCFAFYGRQNAAFTANVGLRAKAAALNDELRKLAPAPTSLVFLGRIGRPSRKGTQPRSVRQPLQALLVALGLHAAALETTDQMKTLPRRTVGGGFWFTHGAGSAPRLVLSSPYAAFRCRVRRKSPRPSSPTPSIPSVPGSGIGSENQVNVVKDIILGRRCAVR